MHAGFYGCSDIKSVVIPDSVNFIGANAFWGCSALSSITFENAQNWYVVMQENVVATSGTAIPEEQLLDPAMAAKLLTDTYSGRYWKRAE